MGDALVLSPAKAPVRPRVWSPLTGEIVLLEDLIHDFLEQGEYGLIFVKGPPGSGKTTALRHLLGLQQERIPWQSMLSVSESIDGPLFNIPARLHVLEGNESHSGTHLAELKLAPWGRDELIEYLLQRHPQACKSVMSRTTGTIPDDWNACLWGLILDDMAADESLSLDAAFDKQFQLFESQLPTADKSSPEFKRLLIRPFAIRLIAREIQRELAGKRWAKCLLSLHAQPDWRAVLRIIGPLLAGDEVITRRLERVMSKRKYHRLQANAASLLVAMNPGWRKPRLPRSVNLRGSILDDVFWPDSIMTKAQLFGTSLVRANLSGCKLAGSSIIESNLTRAQLRNAVLTQSQGINATFSGADGTQSNWNGAQLEGVDLEGAVLNEATLQNASFLDANFDNVSLRAANLSRSVLHGTFDKTDFTNARCVGAVLNQADLRTAILRYTNFQHATLNQVNLHGVDLPHARFTGASLEAADLTGSCFFAGDLRHASLFCARLGHIDWELADLRKANLTAVSFHMGMSRSGMLFTPIASEGTRTGFYTDDFLDQNYKPVEEIRSASLRNADLRGAILTNADFYLVDLRGAKLDPEQEEYVRKCGAILCDRT